jgi:uncharacterized protein DUF1569
MAGTLWEDDDRTAVLVRFERLRPDARPQWGSLDAPRMVTHVTDTLRAGLGELPLTPLRGPLQYWPINMLVMFHLPWPKGAPTAPELLSRLPTDWREEIATLRATVDRFVERDIDGPWPAHAAFGSINGRDWGRLMYRHMDHHLVQFRA